MLVTLRWWLLWDVGGAIKKLEVRTQLVTITHVSNHLRLKFLFDSVDYERFAEDVQVRGEWLV